MTETQPAGPTSVPTTEQPEKKGGFHFFGGNKNEVERIIIRTFPKIVFLYPTMIFAFICAIFVQADVGARSDWTLAFLALLAFNFCVLAFDFPRTASLTLVFTIVAVVLAAVLLNQRVEFLPFLADMTGGLEPVANPTFFWMYAVILGLILGIVWFLHRFVDYWEVLSNELIHHHGILGGIQRLPAPGIKLDKDITDVFEYLLLRSGRLVIHPQGESKAIILDNVPNINRVEDGVKAILGVTEVSFRQSNPTLNRGN
jgi:hypothetical protein